MANRHKLRDLLAKSSQKKTIEVPYNDDIVDVEITPVTFGTVMTKGGGKDPSDKEMTREIIKAATGLSDDEVNKLPLDFVPALGDAISKESGLDKLAQRRAERFPSPQKEE